MPKKIADVLNEDYIYEEINTNMIRFGEDSLTDEQVLEKAKKLMLGKYYEVAKQNGFILGIKDTFDENIIDAYEHSVVPSISAQLNSLFNQARQSTKKRKLITKDKTILELR